MRVKPHRLSWTGQRLLALLATTSVLGKRMAVKSGSLCRTLLRSCPAGCPERETHPEFKVQAEQALPCRRPQKGHYLNIGRPRNWTRLAGFSRLGTAPQLGWPATATWDGPQLSPDPSSDMGRSKNGQSRVPQPSLHELGPPESRGF